MLGALPRPKVMLFFYCHIVLMLDLKTYVLEFVFKARDHAMPRDEQSDQVK